jgi:hypothetical protein
MARCDFSPDPRARSGPGIWAPPEPRDPGWRADFLLNAYTQAQKARLQDIGKALVEDIDRQLKAHVTSQQ